MTSSGLSFRRAKAFSKTYSLREPLGSAKEFDSDFPATIGSGQIWPLCNAVFLVYLSWQNNVFAQSAYTYYVRRGHVFVFWVVSYPTIHTPFENDLPSLIGRFGGVYSKLD